MAAEKVSEIRSGKVIDGLVGDEFILDMVLDREPVELLVRP